MPRSWKNAKPMTPTLRVSPVFWPAYEPRTEAVEMKELLLSCLDVDGSERYQLRLTPEELPVLDIDPRLVHYICRNVSASCLCVYA